MAFSSRKSWDLTHLSSKYPWLRVDAETIEEFRSPFQWVDAPPKPKPARPHYQQHHSADNGGEEGSDNGQSDGEESGQSDGEERKESVRFSLSGRKVTESSNAKSKKQQKQKTVQYAHERWKKPQQRRTHSNGTKKSAAHSAKHAQPLSTASKPVSSDQRIPVLLQDTQSTQTNDFSGLQLIPSTREKAAAPPGSILSTLPESDALYQAMTHPVQRKPKKKKNAKKPNNILSLSFPVFSKSIQGTPSASATTASSSVHQSNVLAIQYSKQLRNLAQAEQKLKEQVLSQIEAEKAKLPLAFLFERNLNRTYCREKSIMTITQIFTKLQHRLMFASFERWCNFVHALQREECKDAAFKRSQVQALAFFEKLVSGAYVGTLDRAFTHWKDTTHDIAESERHQAATTIQVRFRQRRAKELLRGLKQASLDKEFKRKVETQQLLRFEAYGKTMQWSMLRNGFNLLLQNHCTRRIQFFFRRVVVQKRIMKRVVRREAAIMIQKPWRGKLARKELAHRKELFRIRQALETSAAIQIQKRARSYLARQVVRRRREWLSNENQRALEIQICWRKYRERRELHSRFALRKLLLDAEKERTAQLEREKELERLEMMRNAAALDIERVHRGFQGRKAFKAKLFERDLELAARRVQTSWRKSKGRYVLQLRFSAQRDRIEARKQGAALQIQCCYRVFRAKQTLSTLRADLRQRQRAATNIQRVYRGRRERSQYQRTRRATITIQGGMKCKLARRERQRRLDKKVAEFKVMTEAATQLQKWIRGVLGRMVVTRMRELKAREEQLTKSAALLIRKRVRGIEARKTANLLRDAMKMVELQQKCHFQGSKRDASPLLEFMTKYYLNRAPDTENGDHRNGGDRNGSEDGEIGGGGDRVHFTYEQSVWLQERIQEARLQIAKEDNAIVFLQRMYRGFVARVDFVVRKLRAKQRRELEIKMAIVIQKHARGFLARQRVEKLRHRRRMDEIKDAYIRERKWKEDEQKWKEQYHREQMELQIRKVKAMELKLREAKRDAELAKWRAEEAAFRKQELLAQQVLDKQERARRRLAKTNGEEEIEEVKEEGWVEMVDAYGNRYFYNEAKSESSWERPMKRIEKPTVSNLESGKAETQKVKKNQPQADESVDAPAKATNSSATAASDDPDKGEAVVPEGNCWKCRVNLATKECLDCSDDTRRKFCGSCFMSEHYSLPAEAGGSRQKHDFQVLVKAKNQSQCQSLACRSRESGRANLATYYCGECSGIPKPTTTGTSLPQEFSKGCFYCEECFPKAHKSAQELQHVPSALHFRTGALLCCDCWIRIGTRHCEQCDEAFCRACFEQIHGQSQKKREHAWTSIELLKEELSDSGKDAYCIECDLRRVTRLCNLCGDGFCDLCFTVAHEKGKKQQHTWISWESFSQVGDWLEIFDEKVQTKIFFNIETKESTTKQPFVLKPGVERHLLQFQEREQLQKRKELELESEIVSLKEKLKEVAEKDALAQRPLSRNLRSSGGNRLDSTGNTAAVEPPKEKKKNQGVLGKLFSRTTRAAANYGKADDGLTPEERKKQALRKGIKDEEQALVMSKLKTRAREEKEAKAAQTLGTKQFEASIFQELAKS